ncbi:MAG: hypothetical protein ACYS0G_01025 [Planctomycetota bacterium]|jgi:hypothetical protein
MKRLAFGIVLAASAIAVVAAFGPPPVAKGGEGSASGHGAITFEEDGRGLVQFEIRQDAEGTSGSLLFAAEHHHAYPDIIIRMSEIDSARFRDRSVKFSGKGWLHDDRVYVTASAFDGEGTKRADSFSITCSRYKGEVVFAARGELFTGDIVVGAPEQTGRVATLDPHGGN